MEKEKQNELREQLMPALQCKYDEFRLLGYHQVTMEQIWDCLVQKKWKNFKEEKKLFDFVVANRRIYVVCDDAVI